ncbi:MAG: hypothetical protein KDA37_07425, partial [Planctomycetales bacterium]|nr:hypothetical protein [Planctomycetales bacterium]
MPVYSVSPFTQALTEPRESLKKAVAMSCSAAQEAALEPPNPENQAISRELLRDLVGDTRLE